MRMEHQLAHGADDVGVVFGVWYGVWLVCWVEDGDHDEEYIPITPYYISDVDYQEILSQYGELRALTFRKMPDRDVRTGGANFSLNKAVRFPSLSTSQP